MDKLTYLKLKAEKEKKIAIYNRESFCYKCFRLQKICLCEHIHPFISPFEFVILMHPMEAKKEKLGTGRMTQAFLKNSKIITGIDFTLNEEINSFIKNENCYVLYPGVDAINITSGEISELSEKIKNKERIIVFVIDGTWPCAKKMMKLSKNLHDLPRITFDPKGPSLFEIKEQPGDYCLSTIESIFHVLNDGEIRALYQLQKSHEQMLVAFKKMVDFQLKCAEDPDLPSYRKKTGGYSKKAERVKTKKWEKRSIIFK
jgi:DTW domain-containing protein YfiP